MSPPQQQQQPTQGLVLGYTSPHPFSTIPLSDRASVQALLTTILDPLEPFFSPTKARVRMPGATAVRFDQTASEVEGFARPLWGLASLLAGGGTYGGARWWVDGLRAGTDPASPGVLGPSGRITIRGWVADVPRWVFALGGWAPVFLGRGLSEGGEGEMWRNWLGE